MLASELTTAEKLLTPIVTCVALGIGHAMTQWSNRRKAKSGQSALERIEKKIDENHIETRETCRLLADRLDAVESIAEDALSQTVGPAPDRKNGIKSRVDKLEQRVADEDRRERDRLAQLERDRELELRVGPDRRLPQSPPGSLTPRAV